MPYQPVDPRLKEEFKRIMAEFDENGSSYDLKKKANKIALEIRSRLIDLATWKADYTDEYAQWEQRCDQLVKIAGEFAHEFLIREFGQNA